MQLLLGSLILAMCLHQANGYAKYASRIPNGKRLPGFKALGHMNVTHGGGERNIFGEAFAAAGHQWTKKLCEADTDDDGQTNGEELGDPCCSWADTGNLAYIIGISHPADNASRVNPAIFEHIQCLHGGAMDKKTSKTKKPKTKKSDDSTSTSASVSRSSSGSGSQEKNDLKSDGSQDNITQSRTTPEESSAQSTVVLKQLMGMVALSLVAIVVV